MANEIVAVSSRSCNSDLSVSHRENRSQKKAQALSDLISSALAVYVDSHDSERNLLYPEMLRATVGLSLAAILQEGSDIASYRKPFRIFLLYQDLIQEAKGRRVLADVISQLVKLAIKAFTKIGFPAYFYDFINAVVQSTAPLSVGGLPPIPHIAKVLRAIFNHSV